ncbi:MAG: hypothetical protein MUE95_09860 [Cyclobacteriaceae bacterium]|jgi:hypothetical protein|nr:hypothetical protein [Cyclobacteriaceae bacterium]
MKHLKTSNTTANCPVKVWAVLVFVLLMITGCQEEETFIQLPADGSAIPSSSPVVDLMFRVAKLDGSADNILDNSSCTTVVLPVRVKVDDTVILVNSPADFKLVEDELDDDDDVVEFIYPIQVILSDYTRLTIASRQELNQKIANCNNDFIACVDFKYPLVFTIYDTNNQVANVVTVTNDESMCNFMKQLRPGTLISLEFPVTLLLPDNSQVSVANFNQLEQTIVAAANACSEDDFTNVLTSGTWRVDLFIKDSNNQTATWTEFVFVFNINGSLTAARGALTLTGSWNTDIDDGELELNIQLNAGNPFDDINEDWTVVSYTSASIELSDDDDSRLNFKKN